MVESLPGKCLTTGQACEGESYYCKENKRSYHSEPNKKCPRWNKGAP
jgi:hypothetical protein